MNNISVSISQGSQEDAFTKSIRAEWARMSAAQQGEYADRFETYLSWRKASASGMVRIYGEPSAQRNNKGAR